MYELVRRIWEEERISEEWKEIVIVPIHKRGDRDRCENYRGIAVGNAAYKILSNIILGKIKPYVEKVVGDYQNGFRDGRSVIDNIFALKIINKELWECNQSVHSVEQKSIGLKFSKSRTGSHVTYSCHHNLSRFTFPIFVHS